MYKINWYIKSYVQDTAQSIWVTNWFAKYSNVNDEKNYESGLTGLSWDFMKTGIFIFWFQPNYYLAKLH